MSKPPRALLTRPAEDAAETAARLEAMGVEPVVAPVTRIEKAKQASLDLDDAQAVLVTSRNGVRALAGATALRDIPLLAVGDSTASLAREAGFRSVASAGGASDDLVALAASMLDPGSGRLVHAAGEAAGDTLCRALSARGFDAVPEVLYRAVRAALPDDVRDLLASGSIAFALFFSAGGARAFSDLLRGERGERWCGTMAAICLSEQVAAAAAPLPWRAVRRAARPDLPSLLAAVAAALDEDRQHDRMKV